MVVKERIMRRSKPTKNESNASEKKANDVFRVLKIFCESVSKKPLARFGRFVAVDALALLITTIILSSSCRESWRVYLAAAFSLCVNYYYASNQQSSSCVVSD